MPALKLSCNGYSLDLPYKHIHYYLTQEFEPGKTLYQILFEHLVKGKTVSAGEIARKYKEINYSLDPGAVFMLIRRIEAALKNSPDKRLRKMEFVRPPRGGASPVISRKSQKARYTLAQRAVIDTTVKGLCSNGKKPTQREIKTVCMKALQEKGLAGNVKLNPAMISHTKKRLGLPLNPIAAIKFKKKRI